MTGAKLGKHLGRLEQRIAIDGQFSIRTEIFVLHVLQRYVFSQSSLYNVPLGGLLESTLTRPTTYGPTKETLVQEGTRPSAHAHSVVQPDILITAENAYELYVNEVKVGTGSALNVAQLYHVPLTSGCNVFAVNATNTATVPNPAALIATIKVHYTDGSTETIVTDQSWRAFTRVPNGFEDEQFFDGNWPFATVEYSFAGRPAYWRNVVLPADAGSF
ncbi:hypothetical protein BJ165DRAFT_1594715 [Panaeolus papilionaceus]|nr:hypothetical protein BJ165DRAFT_1594715 [Panaeolus papilionaceus]